MTPVDLLLTHDAPSPSGMDQFMQTAPLMLIFAGIFYFLLIRPQQKEAKEHAALVAGLVKGDKVVTLSGIHGKIHEAKGDTLVIETSPNAFLTIDRDVVKRKLVEGKVA